MVKVIELQSFATYRKLLVEKSEVSCVKEKRKENEGERKL